MCGKSPADLTGGFLCVKFSEGFTPEIFLAEFFTLCIQTIVGLSTRNFISNVFRVIFIV